MLEDLLACDESKILEFKENTTSPDGIIKSIIAFANTAGGTLIVGVKDKTREVIGVSNILHEEERLTNIIADCVAPLLMPDVEIHSWRDRELIIIRVPHAAGPFYLKSEGPEKGVYVRFGSTNRRADQEMLSLLKLFATNLTYDELSVSRGKIDADLLRRAFSWVQKQPSDKNCEMLGIFSNRSGQLHPTIGGVLLFDSDRLALFPDSLIRCARFEGVTKEKIIDHVEIDLPITFAIDEIIRFIERNTRIEAKIGRLHRENIAEYPPVIIREAVINAVLHADYSMKGCHIQIAIFDNRIEIINPGGFPFGQTLEKAKAGFSRLRNRVIGRVFRELNLIEQWGSGIQRMYVTCERQGIKLPEIIEFNNQFRLTLFSERVQKVLQSPWIEILTTYLKEEKSVSTKQASILWNVTDRTARDRLRVMLSEGIIRRLATSHKDPKAVFVLSESNSV
jgi:predicted HTH transcriptional regulator